MALTPFSRGLGFHPFSWDPFFSSPFSFPLDVEGSMTSLLRPNSNREAFAMANTQVDWKETPEAHIFKADLPGLKKEELKVEVEDGRVLSIRGERSEERREETDAWHRVERSRGSFMRKFRLPENVKEEEMKAAMENGVLTIIIPKTRQPNMRDVRTIQIA